jgi:hypothetical protein
MVSSGRQIIVSLLLLLTALASANAQTAADKSSTSTISGKVTLGGKGVSGIVVGLAIATPSNSTYVTQLRAVTDDEGNYRIKNVPPDTYQVLVASPQYVPSEARTSVVVGKNEVVENIDVTLIRGGVITGKVTDADGRPAVEEQVFFSSNTPSKAFPYWRTIRTDDRGVYRAFGLPPGRYTVSAGKDSLSSFGRSGTGYQRTYHPSTVNAAEATTIDINEGSEATNVDIMLGRQLQKYAARGRIIDGETSQPLPNAGIGIKFFFDRNGSTSSGTAAVSTKDGDFTIENLPPGKYAVYSQTDSEQLSEPVRFEVIDQDVEGLVIKTFKGASVSGVAVVEGLRPTATSLAGFQISAFVSDEHHGMTVINSDGSFRLAGLPAGRLTLHLPENRNHLRIIRIERDGVAYPGGIDIRDQEQIRGLRVVVSPATGKIRGVLKLPEGLELPATARLLVYVKRTDDPAASVSVVVADARGQFLAEHLVAGTYEFNVVVDGVPGDQRPRMARPTQTVVVTGDAIADVTITLQRLKPGP